MTNIKKAKTLLTTILIVSLLSLTMLTLAACGLTEPYITVSGIKTEYQVGERLVLSNAKLQYYADKSETTYSEIDITSDMVKGFSTTIPGTFTMTISYERASTKIEYTVTSSTPVNVGAADALAKVQATENYILSVNKAKVDMSDMGIVMANHDTMYVSSPLFGMQSWTIKEGGVWYDYTQWGDMYAKGVSTNLTGDQNPLTSLLFYSSDMLSTQTYISGTVHNGIYTLKYDVARYDADLEEMVEEEVTLTIEGNVLTTVLVRDKVYSTTITMEYTYNNDAGEMPPRPTDVTWIPMSE